MVPVDTGTVLLSTFAEHCLEKVDNRTVPVSTGNVPVSTPVSTGFGGDYEITGSWQWWQRACNCMEAQGKQ
jgi:hypothetical protein